MGLFGKKPEGKEALDQPLPDGWEVVDLGLLGKGGMSRVFRVRDESLGREVAFKVLRPELTREKAALERFVEEAKITAQLDHPNIPPVYALAAGSKRSTCFTMKVLDGITFQDMLAQPKGSRTEALLAALEVMVRVCDAMAFAHQRGILHCDLKPHNVMVAEHGQIYVVDWGLAQRKARLPPESESGKMAYGTPAYMAPEQARGLNHLLDDRTDVFALGGMIYRILTGRPPHVGATVEETRELARRGVVQPPEAVAPKGTSLPRRLVAIAMRALSAEKDDRYPSASELRRDLEDFIHGTTRLPEKRFAAGEAIVREGEAGDCAYIVLDGHCQANRVVAGKTQMLRLLGPGEMFGETAVLTGSPRLATVTALMDTTVAVVDRSYLEEEMQRTSLISLAIRAVASSFLDLNGQTAALLQQQAFVKALEQVLTELALAGRPGADGGKWVPWRALLSRVSEDTGLPAADIAERVARHPSLKIDTTIDRLLLVPKPAR